MPPHLDSSLPSLSASLIRPAVRSRHSHLAPPISFLYALSIFGLIIDPHPCWREHKNLRRKRQERTTPPITPLCNATTVGSPQGFFSLPRSLFYPLAPPSFTAPSLPSPSPQHAHIIFYPGACPWCPQLWGNVRRLPPTTFLTKSAHSHAKTHTHTRTQRHKGIQYQRTWHARKHTHIHTLFIYRQPNAGNLISQRGVRHWFLLLSGLGGIWFGTAQLMLENPQQHHGLSRLHFLGWGEQGETWGVKGSSFVPLLPLHFFPLFFFLPPFFPPSADLFICSWGLANMGLWLHSLTWAGNDFKFSGLHLWILNKETNGGGGKRQKKQNAQWFH